MDLLWRPLFHHIVFVRKRRQTYVYIVVRLCMRVRVREHIHIHVKMVCAMHAPMHMVYGAGAPERNSMNARA